jgi:FtsP/CotA-like multicopper oxidase with cupredoxin domain
MKRLSQFLYKVLLTTLAGIFISISTFPGEVIALNLSKIAPQFREQARQKEEAELPELPPGAQNEKIDPNGCPVSTPGELPEIQPFSGDTLTASTGSFKIGQATFEQDSKQTVALYSTKQQPNPYMPPILQVKPGDTIKLKLDNQLTNPDPSLDTDTNFHYHGFNVSPAVHSDNVLIRVGSGAKGKNNPYEMTVKIPENHQPGLFWYHPHVHDDSDRQVMGGMSGGIIVKGIEKYYPIIDGIPLKAGKKKSLIENEKVLLFKDLGLKDTTDTRYKCYTLNGLVNPQITIQPGEVQFWRIGNIGADIYMNLSLVDEKGTAHPFYILARDGNVVSQPIEQDQILLPPANRVEVLVIGGSLGTSYNLVSGPVPNTDPSVTASGFDGKQRIVATVSVSGDQVQYATESLPDYIKNQRSIIPIPQDLPSPDELAKKDIPKKHQRQFTFSQDTKNNKFVYLINYQTYDPNRIDTTVQVGDIEEWTLVNPTPVHHVFHIHQLDFIVTKVNGVDQPIQGYEDSIDLPPCAIGIDSDTCRPGTESKTVVRIPFTDPIIAGGEGEFVYHCHILFHEDNGMMQNIKVIAPPKPVNKA